MRGARLVIVGVLRALRSEAGVGIQSWISRMTEYDDPTKQLAWEFYWEGYKLGKWIEDYEDTSKRMAKSRFERYLEVNYNANDNQD